MILLHFLQGEAGINFLRLRNPGVAGGVLEKIGPWWLLPTQNPYSPDLASSTARIKA